MNNSLAGLLALALGIGGCASVEQTPPAPSHPILMFLKVFLKQCLLYLMPMSAYGAILSLNQYAN
ncbi:MAG TPA: hypothetical protein VJJ82_05850 [Candidatus Nanoarchaeia archaeon]|nr:hypothetical protein [Candidatus Nanoarchaeia archaeon]